ncbi:MAG: phosphoribosylformylglycinamidine synthase I [Fidelibacterota bacterium]
MIKIAVIQFPGSNTERETIMALRRADMTPAPFLWNENNETLRACDGFVITGGFSYEDRSRAGIIAAMDPVMDVLKEESEAGKPLLGICNGAQILVEAGIVPGLRDYRLGLALTNNKCVIDGHVVGTGYYNAWAHLKLSTAPRRTAFTTKMKENEILTVPFAHAEGRFLVPDALLQELQQNGQCVLRYCDEEGNIRPEFPVNPNGSVYNLAAVCNPAGTALAIMPHPERTPAGDIIFHSLRTAITEKNINSSPPLTFTRPHYQVKPVPRDEAIMEWLVDLIITDNEALSVQAALQRAGLQVGIKRSVRWQIQTNRHDLDAFLKALTESGELYNPNKEKRLTRADLPTGTHFYVEPKEDMEARQRLENVTDRLGIHGITGLKKGIVWTVETDDKTLLRRLLDSHIFFNPLSHDCYHYE